MVYQGSKTKYSKYIIPILQKAIDEYHPIAFIDGMVGGANIIQNIKNTTKYGYDINPYLIALYQYIQNDNYSWPETITREDWDKAKTHPEQCEPWFVALVAFFTSYSARGFCGGFAMNNSKRDYYHERLRNFEQQIPLLKDCVFETKNIFDLKVEHCVIYLDPPYKSTKKYDFSKDFNHEEFWDKVRELSKVNKVFVSEQQAPADFESVWSLNTTRNLFGSKSIKVTENLFIKKEENNV